MFITNLYDFLAEKVVFYGERIIFVIATFIASAILCRIIKKSLKKLGQSEKFDKTFIYFLESLVLISIRILTFIVSLSILGINLNSLLTLIGALGLSLSLAFKDSLVSLGSGFIIIFSRTLKTGEKVKIGEIEGIVKEVQLMQTIIKTEKENIIIPNNYLVNNFIRIIK